MSQRFNLRISGMHCGACVEAVGRALRGVEGVSGADVQLLTESATVTITGDDASPGPLLQAVRAAGYGAEVVETTKDLIDRLAGDAAPREALRQQRQALIQAVMYALPVLALDHAQHVIWSPTPAGQIVGRLLQAVLLVMLALSGAGRPILASGVRAIVHRAANMDLLIAIGFTAAFISSLAGTLAGREELIHFHAAAMILGLVCVGRYLEARARLRASAAMRALARRAPRMAKLRRGEQFITVAVEDIRPGEVVSVRAVANPSIPVDGEVMEGTADIDESLMTGEPMPVTRGPGDRVLGGTRVIEGELLIRATSTSAVSAMGKVIQLVADAQATRTQAQRMADRVAGVFTPIVLTISVMVFCGWLALEGGAGLGNAVRSALAVLVVACPCALGLATPVVVLVASATAALRGILVRDAAMLEAMGAVQRIAWDKTGTLTAGEPSVHWIKPLGAWGERDLWSLAASAEQFSTHPIAKAIEARARREGVETTAPTAFEVVPGGGVAARVNGHDVLVGSVAFVSARGALDVRSVTKHGAGLDPRDTIVAVAVDGAAAGLIAMSDAVRPSSAAAVARLARLGVGSELLTGDAEGPAQAVAEEVGIGALSAACSPADKAARITQLRREGIRVAMVGDGVNDAAALAAADVSIAFATGADVANEAAGINLIGSTPHLVADAVELARAARRIIHQNLFWAFVYNVLMIPLAAMGRLPPSWAAGAMMISSLTVVLNALRLRLRSVDSTIRAS